MVPEAALLEMPAWQLGSRMGVAGTAYDWCSVEIRSEMMSAVRKAEKDFLTLRS